MWSGSAAMTFGDAHGDGGHDRWLPSEVGEAGLQRGAGLVQAGLDRAHGGPEAHADLGVREVGEVEEGDGLALAGASCAAPADPEECAVVALGEGREGVAVACAGRGDEGGVGHRLIVPRA
jgi:hypothetical protein